MGNARMPSTNMKKVAPQNRRSGVLYNWFKNRENQTICLLAFVTLIMHLVVAPYVCMNQDGVEGVLDEVYYVPEARAILSEGTIIFAEHPSLSKLFIASGILSFGDNPWGWRIPSAIFATASMIIFYYICRRLGGRMVALFATLLFLFETLSFLISGLAMLDVFSLTFMLLAFLLYLQNRYAFSGVALALSGLCKMTGLLGGFVILGHWLVVRRKQPARSIGALIICAIVTFMVLMPLLDFAAAREWLNPVARVWDMVTIHESLKFGVGATEDLDVAWQSLPWQWVLNPRGMEYIFCESYRLIINPTVWILIIPSMAYMLYRFARHKTRLSLFVLLWFAATYLLWIPLVLATGRQTYLFYFYPTIGAICLALGFIMSRFWGVSSKGRFYRYRPLARAAIIGYIILDILFFLILSPLLPALFSSQFLTTSGG
ncbi:MAG: phospholipid carrier-dependent glycosyltransferase [Chloroflexi bacterium]|nr:phospholipid carrier-dependent glycosyltransferase [Chloroflexota bacterium]